MRACCRSGVICTRVMVTNPIPGSWTSRASSSASSARIWSATRSGRDPCDINATTKARRHETERMALRVSVLSWLRGDRDTLHREHLDDVADLQVVELVEADAALEPGFDFAGVVLEPPERSDLAFVNDHVVPQEPSLC